MSKITNDSLTRSGAGAVPIWQVGNCERQLLTRKTIHNMKQQQNHPSQTTLW